MEKEARDITILHPVRMTELTNKVDFFKRRCPGGEMQPPPLTPGKLQSQYDLYIHTFNMIVTMCKYQEIDQTQTQMRLIIPPLNINGSKTLCDNIFGFLYI